MEGETVYCVTVITILPFFAQPFLQFTKRKQDFLLGSGHRVAFVTRILDASHLVCLAVVQLQVIIDLSWQVSRTHLASRTGSITLHRETSRDPEGCEDGECDVFRVSMSVVHLSKVAVSIWLFRFFFVCLTYLD